MMRWAGLGVILMVVATTQASAEEAPRATASPTMVYMFELGREDVKACFRDLLISDRETYDNCIHEVVWGSGKTRRVAYLVGNSYEQFMEQHSIGRSYLLTGYRLAAEIRENFHGIISSFCAFFNPSDCDEFRKLMMADKEMASGLK